MSLRERIEIWKVSREDEHLEFKEAKNNYHFEKLVKYCVALANEGGGTIVLGMTDKCPRRVVGTSVFPELGRTKSGITERIRLRVEAEEEVLPEGRVVAFTVPSHPIGMYVEFEGIWMRSDENLVYATPDFIRNILNEGEPDYSAGLCSQATLDDLDESAIAQLQQRWATASGNDSVVGQDSRRFLNDVSLLRDDQVTRAALVLLGTEAGLARHLPWSEVIFEYRSHDGAGPAAQRLELRKGFLLFHDELWSLINLRNDEQHVQRDLDMIGIRTFNERSTREAVLNAISHRDYRNCGSVFVRQYKQRLRIESPGGFPPGITPQNVLEKQLPRNRLIAEVLGKCRFVERSGQGADIMFRNSIAESKQWPDFDGTDGTNVFLTLHGVVRDPRLARFFIQIGQKEWERFPVEDFLVIDLIYRGSAIPERLASRIPSLADRGIIEVAGRGKWMLARRFYSFIGEKGTYTRKRGLDKETNKQLLLRHIESCHAEGGSPLSDLTRVLPGLGERGVKSLLQELRTDGAIHFEGSRKHGNWFVGPAAPKNEPSEISVAEKPVTIAPSLDLTAHPSLFDSITED